MFFNELDYRLSAIKRWNLIPTIQQQSVAAHVFNVERIAVRLAREMGYDNAGVMEVWDWAHHHEDSEALSGDFPSMAKPYFDTEAFEREHDDLVKQRFPSDWVRKIVKLADLMEMCQFLAMEYYLGNQFMYRHWEEEWDRILQFLDDNTGYFSPSLRVSVVDWMRSWGCPKEVESGNRKPVRSIRHSKRGR